jgi:Phosphotransferase enzyme family
LPPIEPIPTPKDIKPDWLSQLLGSAVTRVSAQAVGTGQVGATFRFALDYEHDVGGNPETLIGKFMSGDPVSRATGIAQLSYLREVKFYQNYGNSKLLPIPKIKFAAIDEATHEFALIMGDFPDHTPGNQLEPASLSEAKLAMSAAAQIHGAYWGHDELDSHYWLNGSHAAPTMNVDALFDMLWPAFCVRYAERINDQIVAAGEAYLGRINDWISRRTGPRCLTHGDFRPDNMLFREFDQRAPIVIVDWQTAGVGNGATDIAYYLGTALSPDMRRRHESVLVDLWLKGLDEAGIAVEREAMWNAYRRDAVSGFIMGVLASMIVAQTPRGDTMFVEMCRRSATMIHDHGSFDLI